MTREELREHCKRQIQQFERVEKIMPVTPNDWKRYEEHKLILELLEQEPKTGHWVEEKINVGGRRVFCSECGSAPPFEYVSDGDVYSASGYGVINKTKYCPNCGARMFVSHESEE